MIKVYNNLTNTKEELKVVEPNTVKMYTCGPTVYYYPHIGNMRAYVFMDSLRRIIKYNGYKTVGVMNITDVGHLTSDEDSGDDKIEAAAKKENKNPYEIADFYTQIFFNDLKELNIDIPEHITKATSYIDKMIDFIKILEKKGYTYIIDDGLYFDVTKFKEYGMLSKKDIDLPGMTRIDENIQKRHPYDFALWKRVPESHIMKWDSPWGIGCPGWHIECSAMAYDILGDRFDIHTGGIDHLTVHHENEIAQNDAAMGHRAVSCWMHNEFLLVDGGKMSKSLGNFYTIDDLKAKGYSAIDFKYFCQNTHYSKILNFTFEGLNSARAARLRLLRILKEHKNAELKTNKNVIDSYQKRFLEAINDDCNVPIALGVLWTALKEKPSKDIYGLIIDFDKVLGLDLNKDEPELEIPDKIKTLAEERWQAKEQKNWEKADEIKMKLINEGYVIEDNKEDYTIKKIDIALN